MFIKKQEYERIITLAPRVCVNVLVEDDKGRVLLLKRTNPPAMGQWWFPGGRVLIGETRDQAALRKLYEECALKPSLSRLNEVASFDLFFAVDGRTLDDVTILFHVRVAIKTDAQASAVGWFDRRQCQDLVLRSHLKQSILARLEKGTDSLQERAVTS